MTEDYAKEQAVRHAVTDVINELLAHDTTKAKAIDVIVKILRET